MNVLELIEDGHWEKSAGALGKDKKQVCRKDEEDWPCSAIQSARRQAKADRGSTTGSSKT